MSVETVFPCNLYDLGTGKFGHADIQKYKIRGKFHKFFQCFIAGPGLAADGKSQSFPVNGSIAFHGTADPWSKTDTIQKLTEQKEVPLFLTKNANHSLETGDVMMDITILKTTLERVERFI